MGCSCLLLKHVDRCCRLPFKFHGVQVESFAASVGKDGKAMKRVLQWSAPPAAMAFSQPHVLALLPSSIEVPKALMLVIQTAIRA